MHVLDSLGIGGLENGVINLINKMDRERFSHAICCIGQSGKSAERLLVEGVEIFEMKKGEGKELLLPFRLARVFKKNRIDIVHTRNWGAVDGIIGAKLAGVNIIVHGEHGRDIVDPDGSNRKRNVIRRGLSFFVNRYVTVSKALREWLITVVGINERKIQAICNGVDTLIFNPDEKCLVRSKYGHNDDEIIIGTVGRLDPVKNQRLLIKAFAQLKSKYINITLLVIGDGPCREDLERLVEDLDLKQKVSFLGMRDNVPELMKLLDIFVLPSIIEGISNTILEAMATGLPVIATSVGGNPELVVDGKTGYLVPGEDIGSLEKALETYIHNPAIVKQHGTAGRERAVKEYALDKMVNNYETLYTYLMNHN